MPKINFFQASRRMHRDAVFLAQDGALDRTAGAGHFFGLGGECGLKYLLLLCGGLTRDSATGDLQMAGRRRPHLDEIIDASGLVSSYSTAVASHTNVKYFATLPGLGGLSTWKVIFRYFDTSHADYPEADEPKWEAAAKEIQTALDQAQMDGQPIY